MPDGREIFLTIQRKPEVEKQYGVMGNLIDVTETHCEGTHTVRVFWFRDFEVT